MVKFPKTSLEKQVLLRGSTISAFSKALQVRFHRAKDKHGKRQFETSMHARLDAWLQLYHLTMPTT